MVSDIAHVVYKLLEDGSLLEIAILVILYNENQH